MFDIFKLNYIVKNDIKKIYVFFGNRKLKDGENTVEPNQLYKIEPENPLFKNIFSEDEISNIKSNSIDVEFIKLYIHLDDTIEDIKKKIIHLFDLKISHDEIYLFGIQKQTNTASSIYKKLTNNNKIELNRNILIQYLLNIYDGDISNIIQKIDDKEVFTYNDLLELNIEKFDLLKISLTQKVSTNNVSYNYIVNPYDCEIYDEELDMYSSKYMSTLNNNLLLDFGKVENNNIFLVLNSDIYDSIELNEYLTSNYITKIYFPFMYRQNIFNKDDYNLNKEKMLSENKKLLNSYFYKKMESIDLFYNLNPDMDIDNISEIKYTKKGISFINFLIHQSSDINIPIENIFKLFNSTQDIPLIRYNAGIKKEDLLRLYSKEIVDDGNKIPFLSKNTIFKIMKYNGIHKKVSFYIDTDKCKLWCKIDNTGMIDVNVDCSKVVSIDDINKIVSEYVNPLLNKIQEYIEQSGYKLLLFTNLYSSNIEILDMKYIIQNNMDKKFKVEDYNSCLSHVFNVFSKKIEKGIILKYKRVSNFNIMTEKDELITKLLNRALTNEEIIETMEENLHISNEEAKNALIIFLGEKQIERNLHGNRKLKVKNCAGFNILIKKEVYSNGINIEVDDINNIQYVDLLTLYIDSLLRIIDKKYSNKYDEDITNLCKKQALKPKEEEKKEDIVSSIEKPIVASSHILESNDDEEIDELFDLMIDDDNDEEEDEEEESDDDIEIGDDIQFGGNSDDEEDDTRFENIPLNNPNYFFQKMYAKDPSLFLKKKDGQYQSYSRMCAHNARRQPVILTDEEKEKIDKEYPDSYEHAIHYGSDPKNKNWYICPRYWCLKTNTSISHADVEKGVCGGKDAIIPQDASKIPKGKFIFEFNAPSQHLDSDGSYIQHNPGFLKNKTKEGKCIPCCFSKWNSVDQINKRKSCLENKEQNSVSKEKNNVLREGYIKGYDKILLEEGRWGFLPLGVQDLLKTDNRECESQPNIIKPDHTCILRRGVENSDKKSFIACFADIYYQYHNKSLKKPLTIDEMTNKIISALTIDKFMSYFNGNLIQIFDNKDYKNIDIEKYKKEINKDNVKQNKIFEKLNKNEFTDVFLKKVINSYENFKLFLKSDNTVDHKYLWDILCFKDEDLIPIELNLVIIEVLKDDVTNNVEILCPTNHYSVSHFDKNKHTVILIKQENYYEPIYTYREIEKVKGKTKTQLQLNNIFNIKDSNTLGNIKNFIIELNEFFKKCNPLPSLPKLYNYKENISLDLLKKELKVLKSYVLNYYVINYNGKVIGVNITINDGTSGFLPCYPSSIPSNNSKLKFIDENEWDSYENTIKFLNIIKSKNSNILCNPKQRVIEDNMIIGLITETNQFIPFNQPVEYYEDPMLVDDINQYNHMDADKIILTSQKVDNERVEYINKIKLETLFYSSFRNVVKILINKYENQSYRYELQNVIEKQNYLMYYEKLEKIINILKKMCENHVEFIEYDEKILLEIKNISLCFDDCKKPYCLQKETDSCKFIIPENNLMSNKSNSVMYYGKISDELIRHYRLRSYILDQNSYLSFSKLIYNISENEIILPQSYITKEYFDSFKNKNLLDLNDYVITNTHDSSSIDHVDLQKYNKKINYNDIVIEKESPSKEKEVVTNKQEKDTKVGKRFNIVTSLKKTKCYNIQDIRSKKLRDNILNGYKEREYFRSKICNQLIASELFNPSLTTQLIKNKLIEQYSEYLNKYGTKLFDILSKEGKNINKIKEGKETLENNIISDNYFLTILDILLLGKSSKIGVLFFNNIFTKNKKKIISFIINGEYDKYVIIIQGAKAMLHHGDKQLLPKFSVIIKEDESIYHNKNELINKINNNNYEVEFYSLDQYVNSKIEENNVKEKIILKE